MKKLLFIFGTLVLMSCGNHVKDTTSVDTISVDTTYVDTIDVDSVYTGIIDSCIMYND